MDILLLAGRILYGLYFIILGASFAKNSVKISERRGFAGLPWRPAFFVYALAFLAAAGGIGVIAGVHPGIALGAIVAVLAFTSLRLHDYWNVDEPQMISMEMSHFMKNLALIGAALMMYSILTPWSFSL